MTECSVAQIPGVFDPKSDVKDIISTFRAEMSTLISQAGGEARVTLVRAYQLTDSLINSLSAAYGENLKLTFGELDDQQKKAFYDTRKLIEDIRTQAAGPIKEATDTVNRASAVIADVASWTKKPMITSYNPSYVAPVSISDSVIVSISGFRLQAVGYDDPKLVVGGKKFPPVQLTDVALGFQIPRSAFSSLEKKSNFQSADLILYRDSGGWWPWRRPAEVKFKLLFTVLPDVLGTYSVATVVRNSYIDRQQFISPDVEVVKNGGGGAEYPGGCYSPHMGYRFDISTAVAQETKHTAYKDDDHSPGTNVGGVSIKEEMKTPDQICISVIANTNCTECGATTAGHLEVDEVRTFYADDPTDTGILPLAWKGKPPAIPQPDNLRSQTISMTLFDEVPLVGSPTSPPTTPFVQVENDERNHMVYLRPQLVWMTP
jgi:hypothetical protein